MWHPNTKLEQELSQSEIDDVVQLQRFLLSVTAKDVSLLITFREVEGNSISRITGSGGPDTGTGVGQLSFDLQLTDAEA